MMAMMFAIPAMAQDAADTEDERSLLSDEIIVTAQKRAQNVQDVGIAITTYSGEQLRELGVTDSPELAAFSPGVHISGNLAGQNTQLTIRGVTQNDFNDIVEAPNAAYLDEGYIAIAQGQTFAVFDIDRVELLKGPQGTLFGRNATGGLVHYISRKPSFDEFEGYIDLSYGLYDSPTTPGAFRGEAAIGGPLGEKLAARASFMWSKRDALLINDYPAGAVGGSPGPGAGANLGDDDTLAGRFTLAARPSDTVRFTLSANAARSNLATGPYQQKPTINVFDAAGELVNVIDVAANETRASIGGNGQDLGSDLNNDGVFGDTFGRPAGADFFGFIDADGADFRTSSDFAFKDQGQVDTWGVNLKTEIDLSDSITLTSISDYKDFEKLLFIDVDAGPGNQSANYAGVDATTFTQELRLNGKTDSINWVAGLYYLNIDAQSANGLKFPVGSVVPGAPFDLASVAHLKTNSYSAFGQAEWEFAEKFTLIIGARVIREEKNYNFFQALFFTQDSRQINQGAPLVIGPVFGSGGPEAFAADTGQTLWAGKFQLEYRPNNDLLLYAGANRGVKAGSFNAQLAGGLAVPASAIPYKDETLISYEGGFKLTLPDGRTRINGSTFYYDYNDYQSFLFTGVSGVVINADARTYGGELELQTSPLSGLDIAAGVSWFDATVKDVPLRVGGPIIRDVKPTYAPEFQLNGLIRYAWDALGGRMSIGGDAQYSDSYFYNLRNFDADKFNSYFVLNAGISWTDASDTWRLGLDVKNITDERVGIQGFDLAGLCGCNEVSYKPPRFFALSSRYSF
ncbi:MAG: TonB-dependent receptor [Sphingomonadales bacterium BRH_c42]|nr:MAG: TonB-dependent receptor [Sphingomonadales bacterium BRH_c42]